MTAIEPSMQREAFKAMRPIQTRWMDNDHYGHVNNVVYYSYFDTAVNSFLIERSGVDIRELDAIGVVAETSCRFFAAVSFPERLFAGLRVQRLGNSSVVYDIGLFREIGPAVALAKFVHVYVDSKSRKSVPIPTIIRSALQELIA